MKNWLKNQDYHLNYQQFEKSKIPLILQNQDASE